MGVHDVRRRWRGHAHLWRKARRSPVGDVLCFESLRVPTLSISHDAVLGLVVSAYSKPISIGVVPRRTYRKCGSPLGSREDGGTRNEAVVRLRWGLDLVRGEPTRAVGSRCSPPRCQPTPWG